MRQSRICVFPEFKYKLERAKLEKEAKENRKITLVEFTRDINISFPDDFSMLGRKKVKNNDGFNF